MFVRRRQRSFQAAVYAWTLRQSLPLIPVPLDETVPAAQLDLRATHRAPPTATVTDHEATAQTGSAGGCAHVCPDQPVAAQHHNATAYQLYGRALFMQEGVTTPPRKRGGVVTLAYPHDEWEQRKASGASFPHAVGRDAVVVLGIVPWCWQNGNVPGEPAGAAALLVRAGYAAKLPWMSTMSPSPVTLRSDACLGVI